MLCCPFVTLTKESDMSERKTKGRAAQEKQAHTMARTRVRNNG